MQEFDYFILCFMILVSLIINRLKLIEVEWRVVGVASTVT